MNLIQPQWGLLFWGFVLFIIFLMVSRFIRRYIKKNDK